MDPALGDVLSRRVTASSPPSAFVQGVRSSKAAAASQDPDIWPDIWKVGGDGSSTRLPAGSLLFVEESEVVSLFKVRRGVLMLYKLLPDGRRLVTDFVFPGQIVELTTEPRHHQSAEAITPVVLTGVARGRFEEALNTRPEFECWFFSMLRRDLRTTHDRLLSLGRRTARERIAYFLLDLSKRAARRGDPAKLVWVPMNRQAIGDHLGLTLETVSRVLSGFGRRRLIHLHSAHLIELLESDRLASIASGYALSARGER